VQIAPGDFTLVHLQGDSLHCDNWLPSDLPDAEGGRGAVQHFPSNPEDFTRHIACSRMILRQRLDDEAGKANPKYFGFDGARARFLRFFPNGFHSSGYTNAERNYKIAAKQRLDETAPPRAGSQRLLFGRSDPRRVSRNEPAVALRQA
jgi:hypothetical protein